MEAFLSQTKKELSELASFSKVNIVLGNESCDLDSAVSAIVYAFYLSKREDNPLTPCIPCLNLNHKDLALRTETVYYLERNNINLSDLTCRDQIDLAELHRDQRLNLFLVDHNSLPSSDSEFEGAVVEVVDHHSYSGDDAPDGVIELVGSCSTLVAEHLLQEDSNWVSNNIDETVAKLLIGTILFDTVNLLESAGRVTPKDVKMVQDLQIFCPDLNQDEIYQQIHDAKFDVAGLSTLDLLRKDFKTVSGRGADITTETTIGVSSITLEMENILQRPDMRDDFESFCTSRNLQILILMTISIDSDGSAERWLLLYNPGNSACQELISDLKDDQQLTLSILNEEEEGITLFKQENSKISRKVMMPVLQAFLDKQDQDDLLAGNFNNSALVDFSGGGEASSDFLDFDPFGSPAAGSFETGIVSGDKNDPFGSLDLLAGESLVGEQDSFSFDPFATIVEDDPSFTSPKSPLSPSGQEGPADLLGMDPFGAPEQLIDPFASLNVQESTSDSFDPFQTISPSSDSFNSQEDLLGAPAAPADPFDLFTRSTDQDSTPVPSTDPFDMFTNGSNQPTDPFASHHSDGMPNNSNTYSDGFDLLGGAALTEEGVHQTFQTTDYPKVSDGSVNSFEFVDRSDCVEEPGQAMPILDIPRNVPPTPQNSYADMSELQKIAENKDFDHDELLKKVQKLDAVNDDVIVIASNFSNTDDLDENGFEESSKRTNGLEDYLNSDGKQLHGSNQQENELFSFSEISNQTSNKPDTHQTVDKASPIESNDSTISNKARTTSCGSEGSASYTDDLSDSSSGDSYSLNEIPQYASHHVITEIQEEEEEEEEEEEDDHYIIERNNFNNSNRSISNNLEEPLTLPVNNGIEEDCDKDKQTLIPAIVIDEVQKRRHSEEQIDVPYIVVEEVENMNFSDDDEEETVTSSTTQHTEAEPHHSNNDSPSSSVLQRVDSEAVEEYVERIVGAAVNTIHMEDADVNGQLNNDLDLHAKKSSATLERVDSEAVEEYVENVVGAAVNTIHMEVADVNGQLSNDLDLQAKKSSATLERVDSEAVEEYVENVVGAAVNTINMEDADMNDQDLQMKESSATLQRVDSDAIEEYVEHVVGAAVNTIKEEDADVNEQSCNDQDLQEEKSSATLERVDSEAVEEYVENVVGAAVDTIKEEDATVKEQMNNDNDLQTKGSSATLQRIDSDAVEEYVEHVVEAAVDNLKMDTASKDEEINTRVILQSENEHVHILSVDDVGIESAPILDRNGSEDVKLSDEHVVEAAVETTNIDRSMIIEQDNYRRELHVIQEDEQTHSFDYSSDEMGVYARDNPERDDDRVIETAEVVITQSTTYQSMPPDPAEATQSNKESPTEHKKVLELSMDLEEDSDDEVVSRERSSSAVNLIEEMAAAANQRKEPLKRPTDLQEGVSIDDSINSPVSGLSFDALTPDEEVEFVKSLAASVPLESTPKKPLTVDEDVKKKISIDWNEDADIVAKAKERQKMKEQEDARQKTLNKTLSEASFAAKVRMSDVSISEEWQDDDYSHQKLQGLSTGTLTPQEDSFFERTVPTFDGSIEEEEGYDDKMVQLDGVTLRADYSLRDRRLTTDSAILDAAYPVDEDDDDDDDDEDDNTDSAFVEERPVPPSSLNVGGARPKHRKKVNIPAGLTLDMEAAADDQSQAPTDSAILTPSSTEMSWEDDTPLSSKAATPNVPAEPIPEYTAKEEFDDRHNWRKVSIGGTEHSIDMNVINPYRKVLSHGGYYGDGLNAIIVFASCYMPDKTRKDYSYVMDHLFLYIVSTLELLVAQDYMIIYFHGAASRRKVPGMAWMRRCYRLVDRRLRKNLKGLYIVHPTMWLKTVVGFTKPFISSKFSSKLKFVYQLDELKELVPMEYVYVPEEVRKFDMKRTQKENEGFWGWISVMLALDEDSASVTSELSDTDSDFVMDSYIPSAPPTDKNNATDSRTRAEPGRIQFSSSESESESEEPSATKCFVNDSFRGSRINVDDEFIEDDYMRCHMTSSTVDTRILSPHQTVSGGTTPRLQSPHGILRLQEDELEAEHASSARDWLLYPEAGSRIPRDSRSGARNNETDFLMERNDRH